MPLIFDYEEIAGKFYPVIPIELETREKTFLNRAYVDSGAGFSIFNAEIADYTGLDYRSGEMIFPAGVSGHIRAYINEILISVGNIKVSCNVLFSDEFTVEFNLLGRARVFDRFKVCFDDSRRRSVFMRDYSASARCFQRSCLEELGKDGITVQRYKGLGEMNPSQLWETTMDPETRNNATGDG